MSRGFLMSLGLVTALSSSIEAKEPCRSPGRTSAADALTLSVPNPESIVNEPSVVQVRGTSATNEDFSTEMKVSKFSTVLALSYDLLKDSSFEYRKEFFSDKLIIRLPDSLTDEQLGRLKSYQATKDRLEFGSRALVIRGHGARREVLQTLFDALKSEVENPSVEVKTALANIPANSRALAEWIPKVEIEDPSHWTFSFEVYSNPDQTLSIPSQVQDATLYVHFTQLFGREIDARLNSGAGDSQRFGAATPSNP